MPASKLTFDKGDYIVVLYNTVDSSFPYQYCFKQREECSYLRPALDCEGSRYNGWGAIHTDDHTKWRYATASEAAEYDRLGKPYDVTTLKTPIVKPVLACPLVKAEVYYTRESQGTSSWWGIGRHLKDIGGSEGLTKRAICSSLISNTGDLNFYGKETSWCYEDSTRQYRLANKDEVTWLEACEKAGKFIPKEEALKPKSEYVVGKWYTAKGWTHDSYCKLLRTDKNKIYYSEEIYGHAKKPHNYSKESGSNLWIANELIEVSLSSIQQYLPEGHPDKYPANPVKEKEVKDDLLGIQFEAVYDYPAGTNLKKGDRIISTRRREDDYYISVGGDGLEWLLGNSLSNILNNGFKQVHSVNHNLRALLSWDSIVYDYPATITVGTKPTITDNYNQQAIVMKSKKKQTKLTIINTN